MLQFHLVLSRSNACFPQYRVGIPCLPYHTSIAVSSYLLEFNYCHNTNSKEQSPSSEPNSCSSSRKIPSNWWNPRVLYRIHKSSLQRTPEFCKNGEFLNRVYCFRQSTALSSRNGWTISASVHKLIITLYIIFNKQLLHSVRIC